MLDYFPLLKHNAHMNTLANDDRIRVVAALVEGNSIRSTSRMTGIARNTVTKLLVDLGQACMVYHDHHVRDVTVRRLQCDEIWAYVGAKAKNVSAEKKEIGWETFGRGSELTPIRNL